MKDPATRSGLIGITTVSLLLIAIGLLTVITSCSSDSNAKADKVNEKRIDSQAIAVSDDAKDEAKKMAQKMVDLAGMQLTARKLSEESLKRAANPQVRMFAQRVLSANQQADNELRQLATALSFQLPTALNSEGSDRVKDLQNAKAGTAFDLKYLDELSKVAKKSANVAEDLEDDGTTDPVKQYGAKLRKAQENAADEIKQLKNVIN